jgi:ligand-binding sensor domain-containing protein
MIKLQTVFIIPGAVQGSDNISIDYESIFQMLEDRDGNIWIATKPGHLLYRNCQR